MNLALFAGSANVLLAEAIAERLGVRMGGRMLDRFPDGELHAAVVDNVRGDDVYLVQPTSPPVDANLLELLLLADACRRAGASRLTAVVPYFGYARQDRRSRGCEAVGARVVADLVRAAGVERLVAVDLHTPSLEGFFAMPVEHLTAVSLLVDHVRSGTPANPVVVAPDLGAVKLAERYARALHCPVATVHKTRLTGTEVSVRAIAGEVQGRAPVVVDDMISTGGTIEAAVQGLLAAGCVPEITVVATHALLVGPAVDRLRALPLRRVVVADSVPVAPNLPLPLEVASLGPLLAEAIKALHSDQSLGALLAGG